MTREEQDKLWAELSEERKQEIIKNYRLYSNETDGISQGIVMSYDGLFGKHNLQPTLTYDDVCKELFEGKSAYYGIANGEVQMETNCHGRLTDCDLCTSERQVFKIQAINKLLNVAKFLNKNKDGSGWVPDWEDVNEAKWYPCIHKYGIDINYTEHINWSIVHFRTKELAQQAVQILGEDVVRTALTTNY